MLPSFTWSWLTTAGKSRQSSWQLEIVARLLISGWIRKLREAGEATHFEGPPLVA